MSTDTCSLVALRLSAWSARKHDKGVSAEVTTGKHAQSDSARVNKLLVSKNWLGPIQQIDNMIRSEFYRLTLAYPVTSIRVLPETARERLYDRMAGLFIERQERVGTAADEYAQELERSRQRLGDLFSESDYPTINEVKAKYGHKLLALPMPAGWKAGIDDDSIKEMIEAARTEGFQAAYRDAWDRIADCARNISSKLAAFKPADADGKAENVFRDSLIENAKELVETLESMIEVFGDDSLNEALATLKSQIAEQSPEMLRADEAKRAHVTKVATDLLNAALAKAGSDYQPPASGTQDAPQADEEPPKPAPKPAVPGKPAQADVDIDGLLA